MPNIKSAIKKAKQDALRKKRNDKQRGEIESLMRSAVKGVSSKVEDFLGQAYSKIDKAAKKNVIHQNKAGRLKRHVSRLVSKAK
jgi:small subunit ribosomal protein S20